MKTIMIIIGGTGDLMTRKMLRPLLELFKEKPDTFPDEIYGCGYEDFDDDAYRAWIQEKLGASIPIDDEFLQRFRFAYVDFTQEKTFQAVNEIVGAHTDDRIILYLACSPLWYTQVLGYLSMVCDHLEACPLLSIVIEKPYGLDLLSAEKNEKMLLELAPESRIWRVDHYIPKDGMQDIGKLRDIISKHRIIWDHTTVQSIVIHLLEPALNPARIAYYNTTGALVDVGQNHVLEMIAYMLTDQPGDHTYTQESEMRQEVIQSLSLDTSGEVLRGQYDTYPKYNWDTETFAYFVLKSSLPAWQGVPIICAMGKGFQEKDSSITVKIRSNARNILSEVSSLVWEIEPHECIKIETRITAPQQDLHTLCFPHAQKSGEYREVFQDIFSGSHAYGVSHNEVMASWRLTDEIREKMDGATFITYREGVSFQDFSSQFLPTI